MQTHYYIHLVVELIEIGNINIRSFVPLGVPVLLGLTLHLVLPLLFLDEILTVMFMTMITIRAIHAPDRTRKEHTRSTFSRGVKVVSFCRTATMS